MQRCWSKGDNFYPVDGLLIFHRPPANLWTGLAEASTDQEGGSREDPSDRSALLSEKLEALPRCGWGGSGRSLDPVQVTI